MYDQYLGILEKSNLFKGIKREDIKSLLYCLRPNIKSYKKGEFISITGDEANFVLLILKGCVNLYSTREDGYSMLTSTFCELDIIGEVDAFSEPYESLFDIIAAGDVTILSLRKDIFISRCPQGCSFHETITYNMLMCLATNTKTLNARMNYLTLKTPRQKTVNYILNNTKKNVANLPLSREQTADFLNIPRPSLSRELIKLKNDGIIDFKKNKITVLKMKELAELSY